MITTPAIILVKPQMGENIGAAARAMLNCGLSDLRLVAPRDGWPSVAALSTASGAFDLMPEPCLFETTEQAIADCHYVYATTARPRDMIKPVTTPQEAAIHMKRKQEATQKIGILFGGERAGLDNDDVSLSHEIITAPLNPAFSSLNLAQAVLLVAYQWQITQNQEGSGETHIPASHGEMDGFLTRLEHALDMKGFFRTDEIKPTMIRNIRNFFMRGHPNDQELRTLHGIVTALGGLETKRTPKKPDRRIKTDI